MHFLLQVKIQISQLETLFQLLMKEGYDLIGPKRVDQAITYTHIKSIQDLPKGWTDIQEKGTYRLKKRHDEALFGYNIGSRSFKQFLFPPKEKLLKINSDNSIQAVSVKKPTKLALIGVRACELSAILIQDKVFLSEPHSDPRYKQRREDAFIVSLNCHTTTQTCFCVSMNTGPEVKKGFDINLNEIINETQHYFICEAGSQKGLNILKLIQSEEADEQTLQDKQTMVNNTIENMGRKLDTQDIKQTLYQAHDHPHWQDVAERCVNCANCTLACPTCFCSKIEDDVDLDQNQVTRTKVWDSCFSQEFTYVHEAYVRESASERYRQWITHKLASWYDQFDSSGCVGCGRCITWCPVGIDITEEIKKLNEAK